jgi:glycosyltransferase involved in cell wall biosynthesis
MRLPPDRVGDVELSPRITVGMPLYKGRDLVAGALRSLQEQTFEDFEVIISVDGGDEASAESCRPFLADPRFRMVVHTERLDWVGNFNWLLKQPHGEFFCYRQHDDTTTPNFFERLIAVASTRPDAAAVYADCQFVGEFSHVERAPSIEGDAKQRALSFIQNLAPTALRGLFRHEAIAQARPVRLDEFRSYHQAYVWLAEVIRWGAFVRVPEPLYLRRIHAANYTKQSFSWTDEKKLEDWTTVFTGLLEAVLPLCESIEEQLYFQHFILDRICVVRAGQDHPAVPRSVHQGGEFILACFDRWLKEGRRTQWLVPPHLEQIAENETLDLKVKLAARDRDVAQRAFIDNERLVAENAALQRANGALAAENEALNNARTLRLARAVGRFFRRST